MPIPYTFASHPSPADAAELDACFAYVMGQNPFIVTSIAALRTLDKTKTPYAYAVGYYLAGDGGGGMYCYDVSDTASADNGGSLIVAADGGRWKLLRQPSLSVLQFGAKGDGTTNDTAAITAAYAAVTQVFGCELMFPTGSGGAYAVTSVTFDAVGIRIRFQGTTRLKGIATVSTPAVLQITGRDLVIYDLQVDGNFNSNYTKGNIWWNSVSAGAPAQSNRIFGMQVSNCVRGLVFGDVVGGSPVNAAQSENAVDGFRSRACQVPFTGHQPNGFLQLKSPILDCNPNEWASQPGYNASTYATNALCFDNPAAGSNHLDILGGEILKTFSTLGYGFKGGNVTISAPLSMEIAGTQGLVDGALTITDSLNGAMTCGGVTNSTLNGFLIDPSADPLTELYLRNYWIARPVTSSANSTASFIAALSGSPTMGVVLRDCHLIEWRWDGTVPLVSGVQLRCFDNTFITVGPGVRSIKGFAAPTTGASKVGDVVWNITPVAGGTMGWVCTTAGTPGTWKTFGAIAA